LPTAVAGFSPDSLLAALYSVLRQKLDGKCFLDNCYPQVVRPGGNVAAKRLMDETMDIVDGNWRASARSAVGLRAEAAVCDARFTHAAAVVHGGCTQASGEMPPGAIVPRSCSARSIRTSAASTASPARAPAGGAVHGVRRRRCRIWWSNGVRENVWVGRKASGADGA